MEWIGCNIFHLKITIRKEIEFAQPLHRQVKADSPIATDVIGTAVQSQWLSQIVQVSLPSILSPVFFAYILFILFFTYRNIHIGRQMLSLSLRD